MHGRSLQNLRGTSEAAKPQQSLHHLRHQSTLRFYRSVGRLELPRLSKSDGHLRSLRQRLDQGKDLRSASETSGQMNSLPLSTLTVESESETMVDERRRERETVLGTEDGRPWKHVLSSLYFARSTP